MIEVANRIEVALMSPRMFGLTLIAVVMLLAWVHRACLQDAARDAERFWRVVFRAGATLVASTLAWVGVFDSWLQLIGEPFRLSRRWESQRVVFDPVAPEVRTVTAVLLLLLVVVGAALFARHVGGYLTQGATLVFGVAIWLPLFIIQQRADVMVIDGVSASEGWGAFAGIAAFWLLRTALGIGIVATTLLIGSMLIAPAVTLALDLMDRRFPRVTAEADPFFQSLRHHARDHQDVPLRERWRPIRHPS